MFRPTNEEISRRDHAWTPARPTCPEEADFVVSLANAVNHATAVVAADPDREYPEGSLPARIRTAYRRIDVDREDVGRRARARLGGSREQRRLDFGAYGERGPDHWARAEAGLPVELRDGLRRAVSGRLWTIKDEIQQSMSVIAATNDIKFTELPKTWLETGHFSGDVTWAETKTTLHTPDVLDFRWRTEEPDAERGYWQLFVRTKAGKEIKLASGAAGKAPGAVFSIDFRKYLPPSPPSAPTTYLVRVTPATMPAFVGSPNMHRAGAKKPGLAVGPSSAPVKIVYTGGEPDYGFDFTPCYQKLRFEVGNITMVQEQTGDGVEEFHVATSVFEMLPSVSGFDGAHYSWGPTAVDIDPDGPRVAGLPGAITFQIGGDPAANTWPRAFMVMVSIIEEDSGSALEEWKSAVWDIVQIMLSADVEEMVSDYLQEAYEDYLGNLDEMIQAGGQAAQTIMNLIGGTGGAVGGLVVAAAMIIAAGIVGGTADDYYGTEFYVLPLPTNVADFVNALPGTLTSPGTYELKPKYLTFLGETSYPEAASWNGKVKVDLHWTFSDIEYY